MRILSCATLVHVYDDTIFDNEDIHVGMKFPSGIAAGPVPAEPTGNARWSFQQSCKSIQTYSKLFPDIYADIVTVL